ncbi:MAG TPA: Hpt domain-containing protein [Spirochaetota bacterium]|jgi:HPt (histidine-containing phosphotransfer) domain-containing protein|nr:Hpt domain-containing protein [Spirochaetota bacterium]OQB00270.1 MAG: Hpt domain protein [Spirochaetes bacterium ADurb.Bin218]HOK03191.1 Hpt domain-containing protein [Spirochaetota bacterium]HOK93729.1 Hpt domain-containing protein [Spirochaetota bacterium]HON16869.1 Hpt domain-containing protein [Spirochaetota bacterium]
MANNEIINRKELIDRLDKDFQLFTELAELFFVDSISILKKIENSIDSKNSEELRKTAHTLKGAVANFSAKRAYDAAFELENAGKNGEFHDVVKKFEILKKEIEELTEEMKSILKEGTFSREI